LRNFVAHYTTVVSVKINFDMPTRAKTSRLLFGYEQELRRAVLLTLEDVLKSYRLVQHTTKRKHGHQQPSIAELLAPQLEQLWP